jgi:hypothetical protein
MNIERIEAARGGRFQFQHDGELIALVSPDELGFQEVLACLQDSRHLIDARMPEWKRTKARDAWAAHHDLPSFDHARRLCYLIDRYAGALTYALRAHAGVDLIEAWHSRRWQTLLDIIDRLPPTSAYAVAVSQDEEHAEMLADAMAKRAAESDKDDDGPSLATWSAEIDVLTSLRDDVRGLQYVIRAANGDTKARPPAPLPRPTSPMQKALKRAEFNRRKQAHDDLVARVLPHKRKS